MLVGDIMQRELLTVTEDELLESVLRRMLHRGVRHAPVLRTGRLVGIVSERNLLAHRARYGCDDQVGKIMTEHPYVVDTESSVATASALMSTHKIGCLPVLSGDQLVGIVTRTDLLTVLAQEQLAYRPMHTLRAADVMQRKVAFAHVDDNLLDGAMHMLQTGVRHLPVVDGDCRVMGVVSDRDVRKVVGDTRALVETSSRRDILERTSVAEVMTGDAATASLDTPLDTLGRRLIHEHVGALLIVDDRQRLVGVVSYVDVLRALLARDAAA